MWNSELSSKNIQNKKSFVKVPKKIKFKIGESGPEWPNIFLSRLRKYGNFRILKLPYFLSLDKKIFGHSGPDSPILNFIFLGTLTNDFLFCIFLLESSLFHISYIFL